MSEQALDGAAAFTKPEPAVADFSPVDTLLKLDDLASGDVRRAEGLARFATRPDLEADIELLEDELRPLVDEQGRPLVPAGEQSMAGETGRTAEAVNAELRALQAAYAASFKSIRLRQLNGDDWDAFKIKWRDVIEGDDDKKRNHMLDVLVIECAISLKLDETSWANFRQQFGGVATEIVRGKAWSINTQSGVSVPKSSLSSLVQRQLKLAQS